MFESFLNLFKPLPVQKPEKIYWHKKYNRFFQVKGIHDDWTMIGGLCEYYSDAQTNIKRAKVSKEFFRNCVEVKNVDKFAKYNGVGWRVKKREEKLKNENKKI